MIHFDEIKDRVIEYLQTLETEGECCFYVIRDVYGRISVYVTGSFDIDTVKSGIVELVGNNWVGQVRSISATHILFEEISKNTRKIRTHIYYGERPLVKKNWNYITGKRVGKDAKVVSFYSYKGGVGRTTALALAALQTARKGKRVVAIDMDLEAPGLSTVLRQEKGMDYPSYGVIDFLVEYEKGNGQIDLDEYIYPVSSKELLGMDGGELYVMQAGNLACGDYEKYYHKLSRVDFNMPKYYGQENPLAGLFECIQTQYQPDYIFIDSRAGIHDIGGLTLFNCSDEVVAMFYGNEQNMTGMNFILPRLCSQGISFYLVNTPVPVLEDAAEEETEYYIRNSFAALERAGYFDEIPDLYDKSSAHYPLNISYDVVAANINSESKLLQLLARDGDRNIYKQISDMLESTEEKVREMGKAPWGDKKTILQALQGLLLSKTASAENEFDSYESLKRNFYPLKEYKYIFDSSKFIITGSKGSGKTALFKALNCKEYAKAMAEYIGIPQDEVLHTTWLTGLDATKDFPDKANFRGVGKTGNKEYYAVFWKILAVRTLERVIQEYAIESCGYLEEILSCKYSQVIPFIRKHSSINEELSELLSKINQYLEEDGKTVIITYDSLDFCIDIEYRSGLVSELIAFWAEGNLRYKNLRAKIFLRNDIFRKEVLLTDKIKLNNYRSNIEWTYDYLLAMLWKRMMEASRELNVFIKTALEKEGYSLAESSLVGIMPKPAEETNKIILNLLVGEKMGKGNKAYTYNWINYRLADTNDKIVPRSIVTLFSVSARRELEWMDSGNKEGEQILSPKSLENSVEEVSEDRITDMSEEYEEYRAVFEKLKDYCSTFPVDEEVLYVALAKCGIEEENLKSAVDHLIDIGVLKEYQKKKAEPVRYHIPDIY